MENLDELFDLIDVSEGLADALRKHAPDFEFNLVELFRMPFDKILGTPAGILTLRALKAEKLGALLDEAVWDESLLTEISPAAFEMLLRYIFDRDIDKPAFRRRVKNINNAKIATNAMTLAEQFRQEGRQEGINSGLILSKQQDILEALQIRFNPNPAFELKIPP